MLNPSDFFTQVFDRVFPELDKKTKESVRKKTLGYILVRFEEECFKDDVEGSSSFKSQLKILNDPAKSEFYGLRIGEKFSKLPEIKKKAIISKLNTEFIEVLNKAYRQAE